MARRPRPKPRRHRLDPDRCAVDQPGDEAAAFRLDSSIADIGGTKDREPLDESRAWITLNRSFDDDLDWAELPWRLHFDCRVSGLRICARKRLHIDLNVAKPQEVHYYRYMYTTVDSKTVVGWD
jgi:hypothetical protein